MLKLNYLLLTLHFDVARAGQEWLRQPREKYHTFDVSKRMECLGRSSRLLTVVSMTGLEYGCFL